MNEYIPKFNNKESGSTNDTKTKIPEEAFEFMAKLEKEALLFQVVGRRDLWELIKAAQTTDAQEIVRLTTKHKIGTISHNIDQLRIKDLAGKRSRDIKLASPQDEEIFYNNIKTQVEKIVESLLPKRHLQAISSKENNKIIDIDEEILKSTSLPQPLSEKEMIAFAEELDSRTFNALLKFQESFNLTDLAALIKLTNYFYNYLESIIPIEKRANFIKREIIDLINFCKECNLTLLANIIMPILLNIENLTINDISDYKKQVDELLPSLPIDITVREDKHGRNIKITEITEKIYRLLVAQIRLNSSYKEKLK